MCSLAVPVEACSKVSAIAYLMLAQHLQPSAPLGQSLLGRKPGEQVSLVLLRKSILVLSGVGLAIAAQHTLHQATPRCASRAHLPCR